jgi:hypothetical protein
MTGQRLFNKTEAARYLGVDRKLIPVFIAKHRDNIFKKFKVNSLQQLLINILGNSFEEFPEKGN